MQSLKFPYPYRAWLTISSDPDNTDLNAWHQLDELIFKTLALPWANSIFVFSHNLNLPDQVSLSSHPEIKMQPADTFHTWGDFVHAGQRGFSRADAEAAMDLLKEYEIRPKVWVDHARFQGNLLHNSDLGQTPEYKDASGISYRVQEYTLDLIRESGICYIWDGRLTEMVGQERTLELSDWITRLKKKYHRSFLWKRQWKKLADNRLLRVHTFRDGNTLYTFSRFGMWRYADIDQLHQVINPGMLDRLEKTNGSAIVYTHLGKSGSTPYQVPEEACEVFREIRSRLDQKRVLFSSVSMLLDYTVLRNHIRVVQDHIYFQPDGIRYNELLPEDLKPHVFSFRGMKEGTPVKFFLGDRELQVERVQETADVATIRIIG